MYEELKLDQTFGEGDYLHLDIEIGWLRGVKLHRDIRFKFFVDKDVVGLEFRNIAGWPTMFREWPGHLEDKFGPYFVISTGDAARGGMARLDQEGKTLVGDIAADLFCIIYDLATESSSKIPKGCLLLRNVIRFCKYVDDDSESLAMPPGTVGNVDGGSLLEPVAALLRTNQTHLKALQTDSFIEKECDILESYLVKIRRDGVPMHAAMKAHLDQLVENNTAIVTLIDAYTPHVRTAAFVSAGEQFRHYVIAWRDRWNSVTELLLANTTFAPADVQFPESFPGALEAEMAIAAK